ncbi:putative pre-mRNA-splicing factor Cwf15/Cwc15 [Rosa chinensis]|uniref:Putative pre-mRNA-splicing factor Cwf15/Cwc15 n=1 Tax=Rosa chinensis TaxID=74649 RepID=A0A2P6RAP2_ROSCH|nr:protein CWC15 homolog A [Rosa chinensis]PRQ43477.1 putative pre-mRNA-splicing factor Cwf15/Cwc15 [Rosa chinensis]
MTSRSGQPTWTPAKGGNKPSGSGVSSRDIASHKTLKLRKEGQDTQEELQRKKRNLQEELKEIGGQILDEDGDVTTYDDDDDDDRTEAQELLAAADVLGGNPSRHKSVRRWNDDVVFRNQSRGETKTPKRFINDTVRNDFRIKFLNKYMIPFMH